MTVLVNGDFYVYTVEAWVSNVKLVISNYSRVYRRNLHVTPCLQFLRLSCGRLLGAEEGGNFIFQLCTRDWNCRIVALWKVCEKKIINSGRFLVKLENFFIAQTLK